MSKVKEVLTIEEACSYLRIPRSSMYRLAQAGRIPCQKVGRHWRFSKEAVDRWLSSGEPWTSLSDAHTKDRRGKDRE